VNHNWNYVTAGYVLTAATLASYGAWLRYRLHKVRRILRDDERA
jgi:hypothetical protein